MKLKNITAAMAALAVGTAMLTSCCDCTWQPGPEVAADSQALYFGELTKYSLQLGPDDSRLIPVTVGRLNNIDAQASIPVSVVEAPEGVTVTPTADFKAGEATTTIFVNAESMPNKTTGNLTLAFAEGMATPYGAGTPTLTLTLKTAGSWMPVAENVAVTAKYYPDMTASLYVLDGTTTFKIPNFLNSGLDFVFDPVEQTEYNTKIVPVRTNFMTTADYYGPENDTYPGWIFYNTKEAEYPEWAPDGGAKAITWMEFDYEYVYLNFNGGYIDLEPYVYFNDGSANYMRIQFYFTPLFNPFQAAAE